MGSSYEIMIRRRKGFSIYLEEKAAIFY